MHGQKQQFGLHPFHYCTLPLSLRAHFKFVSMKQLSVILNFILLIAVAVLYYFHFKGNQNSGGTASVSGNASIVFVNSDSLTENYELYKQKRVELLGQQERIKETLKGEEEKLQSQAEEYQKKAPAMSKVDRDATEKKLGQLQQQLYQERDQMTSELENQKDKINEEVYTHLTNYIKDYLKRKGRNYNFVLGYQKGGGIIFAKDSLDITREIIDGLNEEFKKDNPLGK